MCHIHNRLTHARVPGVYSYKVTNLTMGRFQSTKILALSCSIVSLVVATTASDLSTGPLPSCTDDESYRSSLGLSCFQHRHLDCDGLSQHGLINQEELKGLLASCPVSCNTPLCSNEHTRLIGEDNRAVTELLPADQVAQRRDQSSSCYPNWPSTCQDDASYINKIGLGCPQMIVFSCDEMHMIGFSEQETHDLINACPCSCGIMCGTWTGPSAPSSTSTFSPTTVPTAGPSPFIMDPNTFTPSTTPTATNVFLPSSTPTIQSSSAVGQTEKSLSTTTTVFVPQGLEQSPETANNARYSAEISDTLTTSLFFVAGAVMSLLIVAAYYHYTKKRKLAPELVEEDGDPKVEEAGDPNLIIQSPDAKDDSEESKKSEKAPSAKNDSGESKKSEQASYVWKTDRFLLICDDEYDSKNNDGSEGLEIADASLPRPMSPPKSTLAKMLQEGSTHSNDVTVQEASLGASTICTNDQASLSFEDDYIGEVESYSKATHTTIDARETEDDDMSGKTPQISNSNKIASFWRRRKRLAQVAKAQDEANEESETMEELQEATEESETMEELPVQDLHNEDKEAHMEVEEVEEPVATKVISQRSNESISKGREKSDFSTAIIAENACNALGNCIPASRVGTKASEELFDVAGIEAKVKQAKDDLTNEMNQWRKVLGRNVADKKEIFGEDGPILDTNTCSTFTGSLWTRGIKESTITKGSYGHFDQELNEAKDFFIRGASDFIGFVASSTQDCAQDSAGTQDGNKMERCGDKDVGSNKEGFTAFTFSPLQAKRATGNHTTGNKSEDIEVTNKPMALHTYTKTCTGHGARVVKGIHGALPHGTSRQAQRKNKTDAALDTIIGDMDDDKSDAYTCSPMTRDTTCAKESQEIQESGTGSRSVDTASTCRASMPTAEPASKTAVRKSSTRPTTSPNNAKTVSNGVALKREKAVHKGLEKKQKAGTGTGRSKRSKK